MYAATYRKYTDDGKVGPLVVEEFSTVDEATRRCMEVFPLGSTFAAWLRLASGWSVPIVYTQPSDFG